MDLRTQIDPNSVIVGDQNTPLSSIGKSLRQKINKETSELLYTLYQIDIIDIYRVFHSPGNTHSFLQFMEVSLK
jgi:hypothetical protein